MRTLKKALLKTKGSVIEQVLPLKYTHAFNQIGSFTVPELNIAFIPNPKVANQSIKLAIAKKLDPNFKGDQHLANWQYNSNRNLNKFTGFKFGFIRNPLARLYSCYTQKIVLSARTYNQPILFWRYGNIFFKEMSFEDFIMAVSRIPDWYSDIHFRSQYHYFYYKQSLLVDYLGKFENIKSDWRTINSYCEIGELPHLNSSRRSNWQSAYTKNTASIAMQRYKTDIEKFGYKAELEEYYNHL